MSYVAFIMCIVSAIATYNLAQVESSETDRTIAYTLCVLCAIGAIANAIVIVLNIK